MPRYIPQANSRTILVDGIRTHYLECGEGPPVVLLHDGSYGSSAETSWYANMEAIARSHRVPARTGNANRHNEPPLSDLLGNDGCCPDRTADRKAA